MKIAILTSGILPVPAVQGGAVENLIDTYLAYNNRFRLHDITVFSVANPEARRHPATQSSCNHYRFIDVKSPVAKVRKRLHHVLNRDEFYHYSIEFFFEQAMNYIQEHDFDMVILENRPGYAPKLAKQSPSRIVHHLHNDMLNAQTPGAQDICKSARRIVCISKYIASRVATIEGAAEKSTVVYNGIDLSRFSPQQYSKEQRSQLGLSADDFVIIFTGRLIPEKGIDQLILALKELKDYPHIKLLVLGSSFYGNEHGDSEFISQLKQTAEDVKDRIIFTGYTPYEQVPSMLALADIAALPSTWEEPFGMTCVEAMAMGLPVITTRRGGIPEAVTTECAILLPADNRLYARLAVSILDLYNAPARRQKMSRNGIEQAKQFSQDCFADRFFKALSI